MIVHLAAEAERDLETIGDYIARDDPDRAITFLRDLRAKCAALADAPRGYPLVPRYEAHGIRYRSHGNYLIFYRIDDARIVVIHVLHGARDYIDILSRS